jgi:AAA+ lid domain
MHKLCAATNTGTNNGNNSNTVAANELALLWVHECYHVYADKLISVKDVKVYQVSDLHIAIHSCNVEEHRDCANIRRYLCVFHDA